MELGSDSLHVCQHLLHNYACHCTVCVISILQTLACISFSRNNAWYNIKVFINNLWQETNWIIYMFKAWSDWLLITLFITLFITAFYVTIKLCLLSKVTNKRLYVVSSIIYVAKDNRAKLCKIKNAHIASQFTLQNILWYFILFMFCFTWCCGFNNEIKIWLLHKKQRIWWFIIIIRLRDITL